MSTDHYGEFKQALCEAVLLTEEETCGDTTRTIGDLRVICNDVIHYRSVSLPFQGSELYQKVIPMCIKPLEDGHLTIGEVIGVLETLIAIKCHSMIAGVMRESAEDVDN